MPKISKKPIYGANSKSKYKSSKNKLSYSKKIPPKKKIKLGASFPSQWRKICGRLLEGNPKLSTFLLEFVLLIFHNINSKYPIYNVLTPLDELPLSVNYRTNPSLKDHFNFNRLPATSKFKFLLSIRDDSVIKKYLDNLRNDDVLSEFDAVSQQWPAYKHQRAEDLPHLNGKEIKGLVDALGAEDDGEEGNLSGNTKSSQEETVCKRLFPWMFQGGRKKRKTKKRKKRKTLKHKRKRKTKKRRKRR